MTEVTVRLEPFALELASPLSTAAGDIEHREGFLLGVEANVRGQRVRGLGEATPLPGWTESLTECREALQAFETDPATSLDGWENPTRDYPAASHAVQQALADAEARARGVPLSQVLIERAGFDGPVAEEVPVNATVGDGSVEETCRAAETAVGDGFETVKLKVGARDLAADVDRVRAVRAAVDASLRLDANGAWDRATAERAVGEAADLGVAYVEQPLPPEELAGLAALRGRGVDVAVDESLARDGPGVHEVLDAGAADVAVLKPMALGGPGATAGLAGHLRSRGVEPVVTTTVDGAVARAGAVHAAAAIPGVRACGLATASLLAEDLGGLRDPASVESGSVEVPAGPGTAGEEFDDLVW